MVCYNFKMELVHLFNGLVSKNPAAKLFVDGPMDAGLNVAASVLPSSLTFPDEYSFDEETYEIVRVSNSEVVGTAYGIKNLSPEDLVDAIQSLNPQIEDQIFIDLENNEIHVVDTEEQHITVLPIGYRRIGNFLTNAGNTADNMSEIYNIRPLK